MFSFSSNATKFRKVVNFFQKSNLHLKLKLYYEQKKKIQCYTDKNNIGRKRM